MLQNAGENQHIISISEWGNSIFFVIIFFFLNPEKTSNKLT